MRYLLCFLFCFCIHELSAQVPGFMGKRCTFFIDANPTPAFFAQNVNNEIISNPLKEAANTDKVNRFAYNFRPQATFEYLVSKNLSLGLSYSLIRTGTAKPYSNYEYSIDDDATLDPDVIKGSAVGIHLKRYRFNESASSAPIGFYQTFSVYVTKANTYDTKRSSVKQFKNDFIYPVISFGFGRQSMILNNVILKTGMELGTAIVPSNFLFAEAQRDEWTIQDYAGYNVHRNLFGYYFLSFSVAIGYIPF